MTLGRRGRIVVKSRAEAGSQPMPVRSRPDHARNFGAVIERRLQLRHSRRRLDESIRGLIDQQKR